MLITRKQIRAMILREMAEILPFPGMKPRVDEFKTMSGVYSGLKAVGQKLQELQGAARVGRRGVGAPAGKISEDAVGMTAQVLSAHFDDVLALSERDEFAFEVLGLLQALDTPVLAAAEDPLAVRAAADQIGQTLSMSRGLLADIKSRYRRGEEL